MAYPEKIIGNITGNDICEICGAHKPTRRHRVALWNYGRRNIEHRQMCNQCITLEERGEL